MQELAYMARLARKYTDKLNILKEYVRDSRQSFEDNVNRYHEYMKFVFDTSLTQEEAGALQDMGKPTIEFNILEARISRLRGEFAKQQPDLTVRAADGVPLQMLTPNFTETMRLVESHLRAIFFDGTNDMLEYNIYSDLLGGGFSVLEVYPKYVNNMSFEQNLCVNRVFDPTLCGFDPLARESHKGDGRYCFEIYPMTAEDFEYKFGKEAMEDMAFSRTLEGYDWSYKNQNEEIVLVCDLYCKEPKDAVIVRLSNGYTLLKEDYKRLLVAWENEGILAQPPTIINERKTKIEKIVRYRFCETQVLDVVETNYKYLPLVFVDGNSVIINNGTTTTQMTRPYVYHAKGIQKLKNFAGQSLANELENLVQHKFIVAVESIPPDYLDAYQNVQKADTLIYQHFLDSSSPEVMLPPPREIVRPPIPPQISETFRLSDEVTQAILGSYDGAEGVASGALSGVAFARSAIQSNTAAIPYIVGYIKGINRVAQIIVDLMPKYYKTPRSLPILLPSGKREYVEINKPGALYMDYDANAFDVKVEVGVNFAMQKEIALQTITTLMQASTTFSEFINDYGLQILLDNIEIRGVEELKMRAEEFNQQRAKSKQQAQQLQQEQLQMQMAQAKKVLDSPTAEQVGMVAAQTQAELGAANVAIKQRAEDAKFVELMAKIQNQDVEQQVKLAEVDAENTRSAVEAAISLNKHIRENNEISTET